jgi:hypothetical protein
VTARTARRLLVAAACIGSFGSVLFVVLAARAAGRADGSPIGAPGAWGSALLPVVLAGFALYAVAVLLVRRDDRQLRVVAVVAVATQVVPLLGPLLLSTDAETYARYGELAADGRNPYVYAPGNHVPSIYGPVFTFATQPIVRLFGDDAQLAFRLLAAVSVLATMAIAASLVRRRAVAVALIGLNPLVALHSAGGGHNDASMVALALGGVLLAAHSRHGLAGAAWALSVFVKWISGVLFLLVAIRERGRSGRAEARGFAAACLILSLIATALYGIQWGHALVALARGGGRYGSIGIAHWIDAAGAGDQARVVIVGAIQVAGAVFLLWWAWLGRLRLGLAAAVLALLQPWLNPWYALWALGFAGADDSDTAGRVAAVALTGYLLLDVAPH